MQSKVPERPNMWYILKRRFFKDVFWVSHSCTRSSFINQPIKQRVGGYKCPKPSWQGFRSFAFNNLISKVIFPCVIHGNTGADALKVMHWRWCSDGDALKVMHWRWCTEGDASKVMHGRWCTVGDALKGINWGWCTEGDALKVIYWQIISRTFLAHSALVFHVCLGQAFHWRD